MRAVDRRRPAGAAPARRRHRWAGVVAALTLAAGVIAVPAAASAHDQLLSTDPDDGATITRLPDEVTLTFSDIVLASGGDANQVQVFDQSCQSLNDGELSITDNVVTQKVTGDVDGPVHVLWRVVSRDGHPVSGEFAFTVSPDGSTATPADPSCTPGDAAATQAPGDDSAAGTQSGSAAPWLWIGGGVIVVLIVAGIVVVSLRGRRADDDEDPDEGEGASDEDGPPGR